MKSLILFFALFFCLYQLTAAEKLSPDDCKCRLTTINRIVGGQKSVYKVPWFASISLLEYDGSLSHFCGGTIVNHEYIMTSAHCIQNFDTPEKISKLRIRVGISKLDEYDYSWNKFSVERILKDSRYSGNSPNEIGDFALIQISGSMEFDSLIQPACLPRFNEHYDDKVASLQAIGFGSVRRMIKDNRNGQMSNPLLSNDLKEAQFNYLYPEGNDDHLIKVDAVRNGDSSCAGDSGGPIMHNKDGFTRVVGVSQYVLGYQNGNFTVFCDGRAGYARVAYYKNVLSYVVGSDYCMY